MYHKKYIMVLPFVSICTPTFNRRPFFTMIKQCFLKQDYPQDRMEWIIVDDGTDPIGDLVEDIPQVKYFRYEEKMPLGKKRNLMHEKTASLNTVFIVVIFPTMQNSKSYLDSMIIIDIHTLIYYVQFN